MKKNLLMMAMAVVVLLGSCDGTERAAEKYGRDLAQAVSNHNLDSIKALYPTVSEADSLSFAFDPDSLKVERQGDTIVAHYGNGVTIDLLADADGAMRAVRSFGLFAYDEAALTTARKTGQYDPALDDRHNSLRMHDELFAQWLNRKMADKVGAVLKVSVQTDHFSYAKFTVTNTTDKAVAAEDYTFTATVTTYMRMLGETLSASDPVKMPSKAIGPRGSVTYRRSVNTGPAGANASGSIKILNPSKFVEIEGDEYGEFVKEYGAVADAPQSEALDGTMAMSGTIAGKRVTGKFTFDRTTNSFTGDYGYGSRTSGVKVQGSLRMGGKLAAIERDERGNFSGVHKGQCDGRKMTGTITNARGNSYDLEIEFTPAQ